MATTGEGQECPRLPGSHELGKSFSIGKIAQGQEECRRCPAAFHRNAVNFISDLRVIHQRQGKDQQVKNNHFAIPESAEIRARRRRAAPVARPRRRRAAATTLAYSRRNRQAKAPDREKSAGFTGITTPCAASAGVHTFAMPSPRVRVADASQMYSGGVEAADNGSNGVQRGRGDNAVAIC